MDLTDYTTDQLMEELLNRSEAGIVLLILGANPDDDDQNSDFTVTRRRHTGNRHAVLGLLVDAGTYVQRDLDEGAVYDSDDDDDPEPWEESLYDEDD